MPDNYTSEFKAKVALDAVAQGRSVIKDVAKKYEVSEEEVIEWASQLQDEAAKVFGAGEAEEHFQSEVEDIELATEDEEFAAAVEHGVMSDTLNYKKLIFWSAFGTGLVVVFVIGLIYFSQYSLFESQKRVSSNTTFVEISELNAAQEEELNSYGVVDLENGIYRIPIDSAINRIAED